MQMVKNVLLYRDKTLARKLQELFLTWYLEGELDKNRILEIYVNAIEYGPGLYGIKPASYQYFGKPPLELGPVESASSRRSCRRPSGASSSSAPTSSRPGRSRRWSASWPPCTGAAA